MNLKTFPFAAITLLLILSLAAAEVENTNCFQYYKYGEIEFQMQPEKYVYNSGDVAEINYEVKNTFGSPIVEGEIRALVLYRGPEDVDRIEGDDIVDEFYASKDISLSSNETLYGEFKWKIPDRANPGIYVVNTYFMQKKKFNLAGLSFMTEVPAATTTFKVENEGPHSKLLFDKDNTSVNDKEYLFRAYIPVFELDTDVKIKTKLLAERVGEPKIKKELFRWDDSDDAEKIETNEEIFNGEIISYELKNLPEGVYLVRFTATSGEMKSILWVRFSIRGTKGKFVWLGLDNFPLFEGDNTTIAFCIENSAAAPGDVSANFTGKGVVKILNSEGNVILTEDFGPDIITPQIIGKKLEFISPRRLTKLTLIGELYDEKENLQEKVDLVYDYTKFSQSEKILTLKTLRNGVETDTFSPSDKLTYLIEYKDEYDDPIEGKVVVYLNAPDKRAVRVYERVVNGKLTNSIDLKGLDEGMYALKVVETKNQIVEEKVVEIKEAGFSVWYLGLIVVVLIVLIVVWRVRK